MKKYFNNIEEHEKTQIANVAKLVESKQIFIVASGAKYKILSRENESYTYDYTYNLIKWGFARRQEIQTFSRKFINIALIKIFHQHWHIF